MPDLPSLTLDSVTEGDSWIGIPSIGPVLFDGAYSANALERASLVFTRNGVAGLSFDSADNGSLPLTITNENEWLMTVPPVGFPDFTLGAGEWTGRLRLISNGTGKLTVCEFVLPVDPHQ